MEYMDVVEVSLFVYFTLVVKWSAVSTTEKLKKAELPCLNFSIVKENTWLHRNTKTCKNKL